MQKKEDKKVEEKPTTSICTKCNKPIYFGELCTCIPREDNFKLLNQTNESK